MVQGGKPPLMYKVGLGGGGNDQFSDDCPQPCEAFFRI